MLVSLENASIHILTFSIIGKESNIYLHPFKPKSWICIGTKLALIHIWFVNRNCPCCYFGAISDILFYWSVQLDNSFSFFRAEVDEDPLIFCPPFFYCWEYLQDMVVFLRGNTNSLPVQCCFEQYLRMHTVNKLLALPDINFLPCMCPIPVNMLPADP